MANLLYKSRKITKNPVDILQDINFENSPMKYTAVKCLKLLKGSNYKDSTEGVELCIVVLTGKAAVTEGDNIFKNLGTRKSVFEKIPTDSVYISNGKTFEISAETDCKLLLCYSKANDDRPTALIKASDNTIEKRGKYMNKRLVHNILPDNSDISQSLLVVEVFTDSANWSSYPPHKHDEDNLPYETNLEEIYYHEIDKPQGFVFQRIYTDDRLIDETMTVENGDCVCAPKGYHPVGVPDGYNSYYLNIMAGPIKKWVFHNDPDHEWILSRE